MEFYCPGIIAAPDDKFLEIEKYVAVQQFHTPEFLTLHVIFCTDDKYNVTHVEEMSSKVNVPDQIFSRSRQLNRRCQNVKEFDTWVEAAKDVRHCARRIAAMLVTHEADVPMIKSSSAIARIISIFQSWPISVNENVAPEIPQQALEYILGATKDLESLYKEVIPFHTRDVYRKERSITTNLNNWTHQKFGVQL